MCREIGLSFGRVGGRYRVKNSQIGVSTYVDNAQDALEVVVEHVLGIGPAELRRRTDVQPDEEVPPEKLRALLVSAGDASHSVSARGSASRRRRGQ